MYSWVHFLVPSHIYIIDFHGAKKMPHNLSDSCGSFFTDEEIVGEPAGFACRQSQLQLLVPPVKKDLG